MMWLGTAFYAVGVSGMATAFYVVTDPVLDDAVSTALLAGLNAIRRPTPSRSPAAFWWPWAQPRRPSACCAPGRFPGGCRGCRWPSGPLPRAHQCRRHRAPGEGPGHGGGTVDRLDSSLPLMTVPTFAARIAVSSVLVVPACAIGPSAPAAVPRRPVPRSPAPAPPSPPPHSPQWPVRQRRPPPSPRRYPSGPRAHRHGTSGRHDPGRQ